MDDRIVIYEGRHNPKELSFALKCILRRAMNKKYGEIIFGEDVRFFRRWFRKASFLADTEKRLLQLEILFHEANPPDGYCFVKTYIYKNGSNRVRYSFVKQEK